MKKSAKNVSLHEALRKLWKIRIMLEKGYTQTCAEWMAERIESLIDHMQYGHALIAFYKQDGTFKLVKATLIHYENEFHRNYEITRVTGTIIFWDVEQQAWRNFQLENFLECRKMLTFLDGIQNGTVTMQFDEEGNLSMDSSETGIKKEENMDREMSTGLIEEREDLEDEE